MSTEARLLLISTSTVYGTGYLDHAEGEIRDLLGRARRIVFIPYALADRVTYAARATERFARMGRECRSIESFATPAEAIEQAEAVFVGGGNTFRLLRSLYEFDLLKAIQRRVAEGMIYMGASAGSNVAGPTIRTTNDMPIVEPPSLNALGLCPMQINPHYQDADANSQHMGETREERLLQYLEENETPVIGLREGAMLRIEGRQINLRGIRGARLFRRGQQPEELMPPVQLAWPEQGTDRL